MFSRSLESIQGSNDIDVRPFDWVITTSWREYSCQVHDGLAALRG
jgi:hypothetical protein